MVGVEQWAEIRRMKAIEGLSQREIRRPTGLHRDTIRRALAVSDPRNYGPGPRRRSKLDPFPGEIERILEAEPTTPGVRIRELIEELGYEGSKTILDDHLRGPLAVPRSPHLPVHDLSPPVSCCGSTSSSLATRSRSAGARLAVAGW